MSDDSEPLTVLFGSVDTVYKNVENLRKKSARTKSAGLKLDGLTPDSKHNSIDRDHDDDDINCSGADDQPRKRHRISDLGFVGMSSHFDPHLLQFLDDGRLGDVRFRHVNTNPAFPVHFMKPPHDTGKTEDYATEISVQRERIKNMVKGTEPRLLELFFELVYPVYPIIDPSQFYDAYNRPGNTDNIDVGLLAGILAISVTWNKYDPVLCLINFPRQLHDNLFAECAAAVERTLKSPTIETVQGLLLLMQWQTEKQEDFRAQLNRSKLVSVTFSLGIHLDCRDWHIFPEEKIMRERLWWSVYLAEKWASTNFGVPSAITLESTTWDYNKFVSNHGEIPLFTNFIKLTLILDKVMTELYSPRCYKTRYLDVTTTIAKADEYLSELDRWRADLPSDIREMAASSAMELKQNGILHLAELTVSVLLHRIKLHPACSRNNRIPRHELQAHRAQSYVTIQRIVAFTSSITNSHIKTFWHTMVRYNFSTLFSFFVFFNLTSLTKREFNNSKMVMEKWNKTLQGLSKSWPSGPALAVERGNTPFAAVLVEETDSKLVRYTGEGGAAGVPGTDPMVSKIKRVPKRPALPAPLVPLKGVHLKMDTAHDASQLLDPAARSGPALPSESFANNGTSNDNNDHNKKE
jgi:hypothetical protein